MDLSNLIKRRGDNLSVSQRHDRKNKFRLSRRKTSSGFQEYVLENTAMKQKIVIPRHLFDRFRSVLTKKFSVDSSLQQDNEIDLAIEFNGTNQFEIVSDAARPDLLRIHSFIPAREGSIEVSRAAMVSLCSLLYHDALAHPNDVLNRIIGYHRQFLFTFEEASGSLTSQLGIRKNILSETLDYLPKSSATAKQVAFDQSIQIDESSERIFDLSPNTDSHKALFKSRLAERGQQGPYTVDIKELFPNFKTKRLSEPTENEGKKAGKKKTNEITFTLPLLSQEIKNYSDGQFKCDLTPEEAEHLRSDFLSKQDGTFHIGIEICDAIFKNKSGKVKTFRFPLYFLPVTIKESGREIIIEPKPYARLQLNHMAIANLLEKFGSQSGSASYSSFFDSLLKQKVRIKNKEERIYLSRMLPVTDDVFKRQREVLLGFSEDKGLGGLLSGVKVSAIECDLETTLLYRVPEVTSTLSRALAQDLHDILGRAYKAPSSFYGSLLGKFLSPEKSSTISAVDFTTPSYIPGAVSKSTRNLREKLTKNDLVLLEGPPGTGKTFTIMNLLIDAVCSDKKLLIVSDQASAIDALTEKISEYLLPAPDADPLAHSDQLWKSAIRVLASVPEGQQTLKNTLIALENQLAFSNANDQGWIPPSEDNRKRIAQLDREIAKHMGYLRREIENKGHLSVDQSRLSPKRAHATTEQQILDVCEFLNFLGSGSLRVLSEGENEETQNLKNVHKLLKDAINDRKKVAQSSMQSFYHFFDTETSDPVKQIHRIERTIEFISELDKKKPKTMKAFFAVAEGYPINSVTRYIKSLYEKAFPANLTKTRTILNISRAILDYPVGKRLSFIKAALKTQRKLLKLKSHVSLSIWSQISLIHGSQEPGGKIITPLAFELADYILNFSKYTSLRRNGRSSQAFLERIGDLQAQKDAAIKSLFIQKLIEARNSAFNPLDNESSSATTRVQSLIEQLKNHKSIDSGQALYNDLRQELANAFNIWICRKQAVSFLFPCTQNMFDLVIVDEATQCRVDDAAPLLYRAKKLMVVGDDQQTVLQKNSEMDDYLFSEYELEEHLRSTQAQAVKGGGSNIFSLVKSIKQASVMLDEHYRCPPDIIDYSNRFVYDSQLKIMKWSSDQIRSDVEIDYSEERKVKSRRPTNGKFKAIEIDMVDRFFDYLERTIKRIEKEEGSRIDLSKDVAICYFLLKNEPYMKEAKERFLQKMDRGSELLDGAGAALQGKERKYIFYYWDVTKGNMLAFRQGDEKDKRKGELNVLMSRPKTRAFHFLHRDFKNLIHTKSSITEYLWYHYLEKQKEKNVTKFTPRTQRPADAFFPWKRSSGELIESMLCRTLKKLGKAHLLGNIEFQRSVVIGDSAQRIDLILKLSRVDPDTKLTIRENIGIVDLASFEANSFIQNNIHDYFFQLRRSTPKIDPVFAYMHELADERSATFKKLLKRLEQFSKAETKNAS